MKIIAALLISIFIAVAVCTATAQPMIVGGGFWWHFSSHDVRINERALWWYTYEDGGFWDTTLSFWPPRIQQSYMSKELRAEIMRDDWSAPEVRKNRKRLHRIDDQKYWTWPDYYNLNEAHRTGTVWGID